MRCIDSYRSAARVGYEISWPLASHELILQKAEGMEPVNDAPIAG